METVSFINKKHKHLTGIVNDDAEAFQENVMFSHASYKNKCILIDFSIVYRSSLIKQHISENHQWISSLVL